MHHSSSFSSWQGKQNEMECLSRKMTFSCHSVNFLLLTFNPCHDSCKAVHRRIHLFFFENSSKVSGVIGEREYWRDIIVVNAVGIVRPTDHTLADVFLMNHDNNTTFTGNADQEELHVKFNRQIHKSKQKESLHTSFQFIYFLFQTRILLGCLYLCIWWMSSRYSC